MKNPAPNFAIYQKNDSNKFSYFTTKEEVLSKISDLAKEDSFLKENLKVFNLDYGTVVNFYVDYTNGIDVFFGS
jgi:hypothetical protein